MPPIFVVGPQGDTSELVNYRVRVNYMIVDRLCRSTGYPQSVRVDQGSEFVSRDLHL